MVISIVTTPANKSDINQLQHVVGKSRLRPKSRVYGDKGYLSKANAEYLKDKGIKEWINEKEEKRQNVI